MPVSSSALGKWSCPGRQQSSGLIHSQVTPGLIRSCLQRSSCRDRLISGRGCSGLWKYTPGHAGIRDRRQFSAASHAARLPRRRSKTGAKNRSKNRAKPELSLLRYPGLPFLPVPARSQALSPQPFPGSSARPGTGEGTNTPNSSPVPAPSPVPDPVPGSLFPVPALTARRVRSARATAATV